jgi:hypothetical protein
MTVAFALMELGVTNRELHLFDTFAGHDEKDIGEVDVDFRGTHALEKKGKGWTGVSKKAVNLAMMTTKYPITKVHYHEGKAQETTTGWQRQIALLRLDMDWYEPTKVALTISGRTSVRAAR